MVRESGQKRAIKLFLSLVTLCNLGIEAFISSPLGSLQLRSRGVRRPVSQSERLRMIVSTPRRPSRSRRRGAEETVDRVDVSNVIAYYGVPVPRKVNVRGTDGSRYVVLTAEEEAKALERIAAAKNLNQLRTELEKGNRPGSPPLSLTEWAAAAGMRGEELKAVLSESVAAKQILVASNIPLVYSIIMKYYKDRARKTELQMSFADLAQEGTCGLMHAANLYDYSSSNGARFRTYAWYWVRAFLDRAICEGGHSYKVPRRIMDEYRQAVKALAERLDREPTREEIALYMGMSEQALVQKYPIFWSPNVSLDMMENDKSTDYLLAQRVGITEELAQTEIVAVGRELNNAFEAALTPRERLALRLRFGLEGAKSMSVKECSDILYLTPYNTKELIDKSLLKLKAHIMLSKSGALKDYVGILQ